MTTDEYKRAAAKILTPLFAAGLNREEIIAALANRLRRQTDKFIERNGHPDEWLFLVETMAAFQAARTFEVISEIPKKAKE